MKKAWGVWSLIVILTVVGSALSGVAGAANNSANLTGGITDDMNRTVNKTDENRISEIGIKTVFPDMNTYGLRDKKYCYFYVDVPNGTTSFLLKIWDGDSNLKITVYDPKMEPIYSETGFSNEDWDIRQILAELPGTYEIEFYQTYLDEYDYYANAFHFDVSLDNLYAYDLHLCEATDVNMWIEVPRGENFTLANYDMDGKGTIKIYRPDGKIYGVFTGSPYISGDKKYAYIDVEASGETGYWHTVFENLGGAMWFTVHTSEYLRLYVKAPTIITEDTVLEEGNTTIPLVYLVLHDPSGDGSYSYIEKGQEFTIGAELDLGTSKTVKKENKLDLWIVSFGASEQVTTNKTKAEGVEINFNTKDRIGTPSIDEPTIIGPGHGDVFYGERWDLHYQFVNRTTNVGRLINKSENVFKYWANRSSEFLETASWIDKNWEEPWRSRALGLDIGFDNIINSTEEEKVEDFGSIGLSGGSEFTHEHTTTLTSSDEYQFTMNITKEVAESFGFDYYIEYEYKVTVISSFFIGYTEYTDKSQSIKIGYFLTDDDAFPIQDYINIARYYDKVFGTYLFITNPATSYTSKPREPWTKSSCTVTPNSGDAGTIFTMNAKISGDLLPGEKPKALIQHPDEETVKNLDLYDDGMHNDGDPGDGIYGNTWDSTGAIAGTYFVDIVAWDEYGTLGESDNVATFEITSIPVVSISTDKKEYSPGDTIITTIGFENPSDSSVDTIFVWYLGFPDYKLWYPVYYTNTTLPPNFNKSFDIPIPVDEWGNSSFNATWDVALLDPVTHDVISYDKTEWSYVPVPSTKPEQETKTANIASEITKAIEKMEMPSQCCI